MHEAPAGHSLAFTGSAVDASGLPTAQRTGQAQCECGDRSPVLGGNGPRRSWHRDHTGELTAASYELFGADEQEAPRSGVCTACGVLRFLTPAGIVRPHDASLGRCRGSHHRPAAAA